MPGENCAIFGCSASRRNKGISFFKVPLPNSEANKKWGDELINLITRDHKLMQLLKFELIHESCLIEKSWQDGVCQILNYQSKLVDTNVQKLSETEDCVNFPC